VTEPASNRLRRPDRIHAGYVLDLDGTIYLGEEPLPGAIETLAALRDAGSRLVYLTNKPLERPAAYAAKLRAMGVPAEDHEVVSSIDALVGYLRDHPPARAILTVAEPLIAEVLSEAGHVVTTDPAGADLVVVSWDRTFDYDKLERAFRAVRAGARIVATNPDPYCPTPDGGLPDCAAMLAAIEVSTGSKAEAIVGKPSPHMARVALDRLGLPAADVVMVGDRLLTDIGMAHANGMIGALVLTGATRLADLPPAPGGPDFVLEHIGQLIPSPTPIASRPNPTIASRP
jgi:HAD superfamily hydrolase (TIGR01450 family)